MGIISFLIFGFVVGLIARAILPGRQGMSIGMTTLLGLAGSFVGGALGSLFTSHSIMEFNTAGLIGSIIGSLIVMFAVGAAGRRLAVLRSTMNNDKRATSGPDPDKQDTPDELPNPGDPGPETPRPAEPVDPFVDGRLPPQNTSPRGV